MTKYNSNDRGHKIVWAILCKKSKDYYWGRTKTGKVFSTIIEEVENHIKEPRGLPKEESEAVYSYNEKLVEDAMLNHRKEVYA